jgi:ParB family transcriptional regulator, chromosome partitioning protein
MARDTRKANGALGKTDMLLFDPEKIKVVNDPEHALYDARANEEPTETFIENVMTFGVTLPVVFRKDAETGEVVVEDGRKRTLALREANKRLAKKGVPKAEQWRLPAIPKRGSEADAILRMIMLNEQRFADTVSNKARKAAAALDRGKTEGEVACAMGVSVATVRRMVKFIDAPAVVRNAADAGKITMSDAYRLAELPVDEAREKVAALVAHAPRAPGKKRSRASARRARQVVGAPERGSEHGVAVTLSGATNGTVTVDVDALRAENVVENVKRELEAIRGDSTFVAGAIVALEWVLGDDGALEALGLSKKPFLQKVL